MSRPAEPPYDPRASMAEARVEYFERNGFGADGGYSARWVEVELGPIPLRIPNTKGRVRAVRYHDLHHVLTGYATDMHGESEISAWELGSNCRDFFAAWVLNGGAMGYGLLTCPRAVMAAFMRGLHSRNLYDRPFDQALLARTVGDLREELGLSRPPPPPSARDWLLFIVAALFGLALMAVPLMLVAALIWWLLQLR